MKITMGTIADRLPPPPGPPPKSAPPVPIDLSTNQMALAQITNPPPVILSGEHNLFNPVAWKRKPNGELSKILKTGPDALSILNITALYTIVAYDHPSGNGAIYVMTFQTNVDLLRPGHKTPEFAKKDVKPKSGLYIIRGIKGAAEDPTELDLEIPDTGETVSVSKDNPYKHVDSYMADMKYDPESKNFSEKHVNDTITLDGRAI